MDYIEQDKYCDCFDDCTTSSCCCNSGNTTDDSSSEANENAARWDWLVSGWANMSFKEKMALFAPYVHYIRLGQVKPEDFDTYINDQIVSTVYSTCRTYTGDFEYDEDHHGQPCFALKFNPIDVNYVPDADVKSAMNIWKNKYGF